MLNVEGLLSELTLEEKVEIVAGRDFFYTRGIDRCGVPSLAMADGPHGMRKQCGNGDNGVSSSEPSTSFPTAAATACSFNPLNLTKMGQAMARECHALGVDIDLGPGVNIKRNPCCGRNFEYFSEDPYLTSEMGIALASAIQDEGIGVCVKHFAANNSENFRYMGNSVVDERALREIYLRAFEKIVKKVKPFALMCAYNQLNGEFCSENKWLLNDVLREQWGFDGLVMTDWGAARDRVLGVKSGLDLEMPGDTEYCKSELLKALKEGRLSEDELNKAVKNIFTLINRAAKKGRINEPDGASFDAEAHHRLAGEIAADSAVLMKNDGVLPLNNKDKILVVGELFENMRYQGAGSSLINSTIITTPLDAFNAHNVEYGYAKGYYENTFAVDYRLIDEAVTSAKGVDKIVVFLGLTEHAESEGCDRENIDLPKNQLVLMNALAKLNKPIAVVLFGGSPVSLPFLNEVNAILNMYLPGQNGGTAVRELLFGEKSPCGKLCETWGKSYFDSPYASEYSKGINELYKESIFVGYRYYDAANITPNFEFGHGLSYSMFKYSNLSVKETEKSFLVRFELQNVGKCFAGEVAQAYVRNNIGAVFKAERELRAFEKVYLEPDEVRTVELRIDKADLSYYNVKEKRWVLENGEYEILVGSSSRDIRLFERVAIVGQDEVLPPYDDMVLQSYRGEGIKNISDSVFEALLGRKIDKLPPKKPFTVETRVLDLKKSFFGRFVYGGIIGIAKKQLKIAKKNPNKQERERAIKGAIFLRRILESSSLRSISMCGGAQAPFNLAEGLVHIANGRLIKGIKRIRNRL